MGLEGEAAARFESLARSNHSTYGDLVALFGPGFESDYFLYRFSDPTYVVADALARAVGGSVLAGRRAIDVCGGSGHLTRTLVELSPVPPVLADRSFAKAWLGARFIAPGCEPVCCDANAPLPFARAAFGFAMCSDAFQYVWTKRQLAGELARLVARQPAPGAILISHVHNQLQWSPSLGQPLPPRGYHDLFETIEPVLFGEAALLDGIVADESLDLGRRHPAELLDADPALAIVASEDRGVFRRHAVEPPLRARGEFRVNPLYQVEPDGALLRLRLRLPSPAYADEFGACRRYLPDGAAVSRQSLARLQAGETAPELADLVRRRVILDLPARFA
jgi:hypothetical protein